MREVKDEKTILNIVVVEIKKFLKSKNKPHMFNSFYQLLFGKDDQPLLQLEKSKSKTKMSEPKNDHPPPIGKKRKTLQVQKMETSITPEVIVENLVSTDVMKSEVNLLTLPFFALSGQSSRNIKKIEYKSSVLIHGGRMDIFWRVSANVQYGYPGVFDKKVFRAIEQIINEIGLPIQNPIPFSLHKLCKAMKINTSGKNKNDIKKSLIRLTLTGIESKGAFYQKEKEERLTSEKIFHLYDSIFFRSEELPDGQIAETNYLYVGQFYLKSLNDRYVKLINFKYYQDLKRDISRRLYEILDIKFHNNKKPSINFWYPQLCELLPINRQKYFSDAKRYLQPAHDELIQTGLLTEARWQKVGTGKNQKWKIHYFPNRKFLKLEAMQQPVIESETIPEIETPNHEPDQPPTETAAPPQPTKKPDRQPEPKKIDPLIAELTVRGITKARAPKLLDKYQKEYPEHDLLDVLECFDHCLAKGEFNEVKNKAGLLVTMIDANDYQAEGYTSRAEREKRKQEQQQAIVKQEKKEKLEMAYEAYRKNQLENFKTNLPPEELENFEDQIKTELFNKYSHYRQWAREGREGNIIIQKNIESSLDDWLINQGKVEVLDFEIWRKQN